MGKRLKRIFRAQLQQEQNSFMGREASVVFQDARTLHGRVKALEGEELLVQDMRQKLHRLPIAGITELVLDFEADF